MSIKKQQRQNAAKNEFAKPVSKFEPVDLSQSSSVPAGMTRAFRNTRFMVMIFDNAKVTTGTAIKVMVQKHDDSVFPNHWAVMQLIKNEIFGPEVTAIEYFPAQFNLVDAHNIYWMWIFPDGVLPLPVMDRF